MNQPKALDLTSGWEDVVNNSRWRKARTQKENERHLHRCRKTIYKVCFCIVASVIAMILELAGLLASWIAAPGTLIPAFIAFFLGGQLWKECHE